MIKDSALKSVHSKKTVSRSLLKCRLPKKTSKANFETLNFLPHQAESKGEGAQHILNEQDFHWSINACGILVLTQITKTNKIERINCQKYNPLLRNWTCKDIGIPFIILRLIYSFTKSKFYNKWQYKLKSNNRTFIWGP